MILNCATLPDKEAAAVRAAVMAGHSSSADTGSSSSSSSAPEFSSPVVLPLPDALREVDSLCVKYQQIVQDLLTRQATELSTAADADAMIAGSYVPSAQHGMGIHTQVQFQYAEVWGHARGFVHTKQLLVHAALQCT
jgi:hypothetical protein